MTQTLLGRNVVLSELDPVPDGLRFGPNQVVLNKRECDDIRDGRGNALVCELIKAMDRYDKDRLRRILDEAGR